MTLTSHHDQTKGIRDGGSGISTDLDPDPLSLIPEPYGIPIGMTPHL